MERITMEEAAQAGGGNAVLTFFGGKLATWAFEQALAGNIDYASVAEQQGTYYNTVGA